MSDLEDLRKKKKEELIQKMSAPDEPVTVSDSDFDQFVSEHDTVLVDLWADWCAPCKRLAPILDELAGEVDAAIGKLNVDENQQIPTKYSVSAIPTMLIFRDGELVDRLQGLMPKEKIKAAIEQA